jgi:type II secretory ATPase GspE/PulE/Tfp pilus assembly ATPase PilB-like protein
MLKTQEMLSQEKKSAYQLLQRREVSLEDALKLLVSPKRDLNPVYLDKQLIRSMKPEWPKHQAIPLLFTQNQLFIACPETTPEGLEKALAPLVNNCEIKVVRINAKSWDFVMTGGSSAKAPQKKSQLGAELLSTIDRIENRSINATDENSIGNEVRFLMGLAAQQGASDIHFEPTEKYLIVRFRIDGVLKDICKYVCTAQADYRKIILARIKIIADLNIAESRIPQDGRVTETVDGKKIDLRVSTLPCLHGEKCVIRLLPHENSFLELSDLGMPVSIIPEYESWLNMSQGMVLITGPTGSGKTSTLYTSLAKLVDTTKNVVTVEDPVEYQLARVNQVQVNVKAGLTFAAGLRSILRQDPDIVMVGEIRDRETAEIAIQASLTGHLVLSTLHTNDAPSTITRLIDMDVEPYLVASALIGVVAQRLLRRVCQDCKEEYKAVPKEVKLLGLPETEAGSLTLVRARGCQNCNNTGYSGREGIFELMVVTNKIRIMIQEGASVEQLKVEMRAMNLDTLFDAAAKKVLQQLTTVEEMLRVVPPVR